MKRLITPVLCILFTGFLCPRVMAHVEMGEGNTLQMISYYTENTPKINGCLTDNVTDGGVEPNPDTTVDEWKDAYIRQFKIVSEDNADTLDASIFFMNDSTYLYIGITTNFNNSGNNTYVEFLFDQGVNGGSHNDILDGGGSGVDNGEYSARVYPNKGWAQQKMEHSFNGTEWEQQNSLNETFDGYGKNYGISFVQVEYRIPLDTLTATDSTSYLNVNSGEELGMNIRFYSQGGMVYYFWPYTNQSVTDANTSPGWIDLQLGVRKEFTTFYATYNVHSTNPVVDGNIYGGAEPDDAWRGAYRRDIVLTDFAGSKISGVLYALEDHANRNLYTGIKIEDGDNNPGDYCMIYQEQGTGNPAAGRNYILDNGTENALKADEGAFTLSDDYFWNGLNKWDGDATNTTQSARGAWYSDGYYEYEFLVDLEAGDDGDDQDINIAEGENMGFHILYHDEDNGADYFWEYTPNTDTLNIDPNNNVYVSTGWADMQLGAPYVQVIFPEDDSVIEGAANVRIYAEDENSDGIVSALFYRKSFPAGKYSLTRIAGTNEWSGTWDVSSLNDGPDTLVFEVEDDDGIVVERIVNVNISNGTQTSDTPSVAIESPVPGATVSGNVTIKFSSSASGGTIDSREISIDGAAYIPADTDTTYEWSTSTLTDGSHTVRIKVTDTNGISNTTRVTTYITKNSPAVTILNPAADSTYSGDISLRYEVSPVAPASVYTFETSVDGGEWSAINISDTVSLRDTLSAVVNTMDWSDGEHTVQVRVTDNNAKEGLSRIVKFTVANAPQVLLDTLLADDTLRGIVNITFDITDSTAAIDTREISIDGGAWRSVDSSTYVLDTRPMTDGVHTFRVRVTDVNGKTGYSRIVNAIVYNLPVVSIDTLLADSVVRGLVNIAYTVTDSTDSIVSREASVNGGSWKPAADTGYLLNTRPLTDGSHNIQIRVTDQSNKTGYSQSVKLVVNNSPEVEIDTAFADSIVSGDVSIPFIITDSTDSIASREYSLDGDGWKAAAGNTVTINTTLLKDGEHTIQVQVSDVNGKSDMSRLLKFISDNTAPVISNVSVAYPENSGSAKQGGEVIVRAYIKDDISGTDPAAVQLSSDAIDTTLITLTLKDSGTAGDSIEGDFIYSVIVPVNTDSTGSIGYSLSADDVSGNQRTLKSAIILDNTPPATDFVLEPEPENGSDIRSGSTYFRRLIMKGTYSDRGGSGLDNAFISVINDSGSHVNTSPVVLSVNDSVFSRVVELVPGNNTIVLCAEDRAGNMDSTSGTVTYFEPKSTKVIGRSGGSVNNPDGASVKVSKDALLSSEEITIVPVEPVEQRKPLDTNIVLLNVAHDFGPDGTVFRKPVKITLPYTEADLDTDQDGVRDIDPMKLAVAYWNGETWLNAGEPSVDTANRLVSVNVNHFTIFDLIVDDSEPVEKLKAYWTKNPVKSDQGAAFRFELPKKGNVGLKIVDMAGDLVRTLIDENLEGKNTGPGTGEVVWNGYNVSDEFAGAGLYIYVFTYKPQSGKAVVIRKPVGLLR